MSARAITAEQTHQRILDAARSRFTESPYEEATLAAIAADAGVTTQTVLNRFGSKENLFLEYAAGMRVEIEAVRATARRGDVRSVVRVLMRQYEMMGDLAVRAIALEERLPTMAEVARIGREQHRRWLEEVFGDQLPAEPRARRFVVNTLYAATDVFVWKLLRRDLGAPRTETARVMERLIRGALTPLD
jgi:AcrR family transcriptional regulator